MNQERTHNDPVLQLLYWQLAAVFFFMPAGRFYFNLGAVSFSTGYDAYKLFPILLLTWMAWRFRQAKSGLRLSAITVPLAAFFAVSVCSSVSSFDPYESLAESLEIGSCLLFVIMMFDLPWNAVALSRIGGGFVLGNMYMAYVGISQWVWRGGAEGAFRMNATYDYPNALGAFSILSVSLLAWLLSQCQTRFQKYAVGAAMACALFCGLATQSRATYLGFFIWLLVASALGGSRIRTWGLWIIMAMLVFAMPLVLHRFQGILVEVGSQDEMSRILIWPFLLDYSLPSLSFFGMGLGPVIPDKVAGWIASSANEHALSRHWHPHNLFLYLFLGTGVVGLSAFCWMLFRSLRELWRLRSQGGLYLFCGLVAFLFHQLFEVHLSLGNIPLAFFTLMVAGSIVANHSRELKADSA